MLSAMYFDNSARNQNSCAFQSTFTTVFPVKHVEVATQTDNDEFIRVNSLLVTKFVEVEAAKTAELDALRLALALSNELAMERAEIAALREANTSLRKVNSVLEFELEETKLSLRGALRWLSRLLPFKRKKGNQQHKISRIPRPIRQ